MTSGWRLDERDGVVVLRCAVLLEIPGLAHGFSTRRADGGNAFDLSTSPSAAGRRRRFLAAAGFRASRPSLAKQVHGSRVVSVRELAGGVEADGILWTDRDPVDGAPAVLTADCVPVLLAAADLSGAAAVHAGWRGTADRVVRRAVERLAAEGIAPERLVAALGPSIGPCCYEVAPEVARAVTEGSGSSPTPSGVAGRERLDLRAINREQLVEAGLSEERIHAVSVCTRCGGDLWYSHRGQGRSAGRMMASIGPADARP